MENFYQNSKILVIDDDPMICESIQFFFEDSGFNVSVAKDGKIGLELFFKHHFDLVLCDLRMPEADGFEVIKAIKKNASDIPVIVISGVGMLQDAVEALRCGAWDYILKPIYDLSMLKHSVVRCLEQSRLQIENRAYQQSLEDALLKLQEDEEAGRKIQMRMLPPDCYEEGKYRIDRYVMPSTYLSGDFVDYFDLDDSLVFFTADVAGHGVSSALVTVFLKGFLRKYQERMQMKDDDTILRPEILLKRLNEEVIREDFDKHVVCFYGLIKKNENKLVYASGGQYPFPFLFSESGSDVLSLVGMAIGLFPFAHFQSYEIDLPESFYFTIFSDGILDVLPQHEICEKNDFLQTLRSPENVMTFIEEVKLKKTIPDDIAILTIRRR